MLSFNDWKRWILESIPEKIFFSEEDLRDVYYDQIIMFLDTYGEEPTLYISLALIGKVEALEWALHSFWHYVALSGKVEAIEWALQNGCDPLWRNENDYYGPTFWHCVAQSGKIEALEWALQHGCNPLQGDNNRST
jgi:hypothetical protein